MDPWDHRLKITKPVLKLGQMGRSQHRWLLCGDAVWSYICSVFSPSEPFLHLIHSHLACLTHINPIVLVNTRSLFVRSFLSVPPIIRFQFIVSGVLDLSLLLNWKHTKKRILPLLAKKRRFHRIKLRLPVKVVNFILPILKRHTLSPNPSYITFRRIRKHLLRPNHLHFLWGFHTPLSIHPPRPSLHNLIRCRLPKFTLFSQAPSPSYHVKLPPQRPTFPVPPQPPIVKARYIPGERFTSVPIQFLFVPVQFKIRSPLKPREGVG